MKKNPFWTYLRRALVAIICVVILSLVGIFIFDRYDPSNSSFTNVYSDDYWNSLDGFAKYEELKHDEDKYSIYSSKYVSPYDEDDNIFDKINKSRYTEELELITKPINDKLVSYRNKLAALKNVSENSKSNWMLKLLAVSTYATDKSIYEMVSTTYTGTEDEFYDLIANYEEIDLYNSLNANGYTGTFKSVVEAVASGKDSAGLYEQAVAASYAGSFEDWVMDVCGFNGYAIPQSFSAYDYARLNGYPGSVDEWKELLKKSGEVYSEIGLQGYYNPINGISSDYDLYMAIYNDHGKVDAEGNVIMKSAFEEASAPDQNEIAVLEADILKLEDIMGEATLKGESLTKWNEYFSRYQKVFENDKYEFWFSYGLTTFKIVDKEVGYEWYSNPKDVTPTLASDQKTVISVIYGTTAGAEIPYSNYDYSVSTLDKQNREVVPNYAVKVDTENKIVQVWYRLEKRGIDYSYFPKYISETRVNELLAANKERAANGMVDSTGAAIPDIQDMNAAYEKASNALKDLELKYKDNQSDAEYLAQKKQLEATMKENEPGRDAYSKWLQSYYNILDADSPSNEKGYHYYEWKGGKFEYMSQIVIKNLYKWLYEWCGYNKGTLLEDNNEFGQEIDLSSHAFEVAIEYKLTDEGLKVNVPGNSIREYGDYKICKLDILPYFTSTPAGVDGFTIIPDGSGAIMEHDNGKANLYDPYVKRLYTTDLSNTSVTKKATNYDIMLPMYAVVNNVGNGSAAVIADAENMASQLELRATTSGFGLLGESNNRNNFKAYVRESQSVFIGTYAKEEVKKFTNELLSEDIIINFRFISNKDDTITYSEIASLYREILIDRYSFKTEDGKEYKLGNNDKTTSPVLDIDVVGAYTYTDNFLGISYTAKDTMTTYEELGKIIDAIKGLNYTNEAGEIIKSNLVEYINVFYYGWRKEALVNVTFNNFKLNGLLGSKEQLKKISEEDNVNIYPYVSFGEVNDYQESFGTNHYTTRDVVGEIITKQQYALNTNTYDPKARKISIVSPHYYYAFAQSLVDSYVKLFGSKSAKENKVGINSISIDKFGSALAGDYKKNNEMFKTGAIREQVRSLQLIYDTVEHINLHQPYDYAFNYIDHAKDIPYQSTQKEILDYSIPFYQLVVNGLFDYSAESINTNIEDGIDQHVMKMIETGSNPQFTFTHDSSSELVRTEYNYYYNTEYSNWLGEITQIFYELDSLEIYKGRLVSHERLIPNVYLVTYLVDGREIQIILNYSFASYYHSNGNVIVGAKSYKAL